MTPNPIFSAFVSVWQVSSTFARVLQGTCGLYINSVGGETELDLATFAFSGTAAMNFDTLQQAQTSSSVLL